MTLRPSYQIAVGLMAAAGVALIVAGCVMDWA